MRLYKSSFTPNVKPEEVNFAIGERVVYRLSTGEEIDILIDSELKSMYKDDEEIYGYESIFLDDNKKYFAWNKAIVDWHGKC